MAGTSTPAMDILRRLNPITASPSSAIETAALLDSFGYSLMPRTSVHQGMAAGLATLMGRAVGGGVERATDVLVSPERPLPARLAARAALGGVGAGLELLPGHEDATLWHAGLRSSGELLWVGSVGGALFDVGTFLQHRYPSQRWVRPALLATAGTGGALLWARRRMAARTAVIKRWPVEQRATVPAALGIGGAVYAVGVGLTRGYAASRNGLIGHLGPGFGKNALGRATNAALWAAGAAWLYNAGVGYIGRANERVEPGYTAPPASALVSGSPDSLSPFEDLGQQGRRYVTDVVTPELITAGARASPPRPRPSGCSSATTPSRCTRPAGPSWRWRSWSGPGRSTARICCWCPRPGPVGWTRP